MSKKHILSSLVSGLLVVSLSSFNGFAVAQPNNNGGGNNGGGNNGGGGNQGLNPEAECALLGDNYLPLAKYNWEGGSFTYDGGDGGDIFSFSVDTDSDNEPHSGSWTITDGSSYAEGLIVKSGTHRDLSTFPGAQSGDFDKTVNNAISHLTFCYIPPIDEPEPDNGGGGDNGGGDNGGGDNGGNGEPPLAVDLTDLEVDENGVVRWATAAELNNAQFHVWVRCPAVAARGNAQAGAVYEFNLAEQCTAVRGVVLEDVDVRGRSSFRLDLMDLSE